jgi:FtsH-binding integral membrane protein
MKKLEKIFLVAILIIWLIIFVFIGIRVSAINKTVSEIGAVVLGGSYDRIIIENAN